MTHLATVVASPLAGASFSRDQIDLIKRQVAAGATDDELRLFLYQAARTGLDPLTRQLYFVKRKGRMTIQTAIDGFRLIAQRSGEYRGQDGPYWCGANGRWRDVWTSTEAPVAAKVGVWRQGFQAPVWGVARTEAYAARTEAGGLAALWRTMADTMIAKCAEALALRKAFPQELAGLYTGDELPDTGAASRLPPAGVDPSTGELVDDLAAATAEPRARPADVEPSSDAPATERITVLGIVKRKTTTADKYVISASDARTYHTFSLTLATVAKAAQEAGRAVDVTYVATKYGRMVQTLAEVDTGDPPL